MSQRRFPWRAGGNCAAILPISETCSLWKVPDRALVATRIALLLCAKTTSAALSRARGAGGADVIRQVAIGEHHLVTKYDFGILAVVSDDRAALVGGEKGVVEPQDRDQRRVVADEPLGDVSAGRCLKVDHVHVADWLDGDDLRPCAIVGVALSGKLLAFPEAEARIERSRRSRLTNETE
jgi:hypothetical protein